MERIVFSFFLFPRYDPRLVPISSLSRPADNYVPRGETRWIGEIDRRDRCRLEAAVSAEGIQRKGTNPCAVKHEWAIRFIDRDRGDNIPRPRRSKRGKTPITRGKHVWNITLGPKREIYLRFLLWKLVEYFGNYRLWIRFINSGWEINESEILEKYSTFLEFRAKKFLSWLS